MSRSLLILAVLIAAACTPEPARPAAAPSPEEQRAEAVDDIREAVFRHLFGENASAAQGKATAFFLTIEGADPDGAFLARFGGHAPPVKAGTGATESKTDGVVDRETGEGGALKFSVGKITFESDDRVTLSAEYYEAGLSAAGYDYILERRAGGWTVVEQKMTWIS